MVVMGMRAFTNGGLVTDYERIVVLDAGHFATEQIIIPILENYLKQHSNEKLWGIDISVSGKNKDVFYYI